MDEWREGYSRAQKIRGRKGEPPGTYRRDCKTRLKKMHLRVLNEATGILKLATFKMSCVAAYSRSIRLTLADGKTLECTINHRLYTSEGWQRMGDALGLVADADYQVWQ